MEKAGAQEGRGLLDCVQVLKYVLQFDTCSLLIVHPANIFG